MAKTQNLHEEVHLKVMRLIAANPAISQRGLAAAMGVSLGKTHFCLNALVAKGLVKMDNFRNNNNKLVYAYLLTPQGIAEKAAMTRRFFIRKTEEYELLKAEIALLQPEPVLAENKG